MLCALVGTAIAVAADVPTPRSVLGLAVGQDRVLASYTETSSYLAALAAASPRVRVLDTGTTVEGRRMVAAVMSSPGNLARLDELRLGWARVADPRGLTDAELGQLLRDLPSCALIVAGIHSNEVAGTQSSLLLAYRLAAAGESSVEASWLERTVVLLVPSMNPDGQESVVGWYRRWLGTPHEGASPPFLYHRYAGHDNNRDFVFLTQPESRNLNRLAYRDWHPQVFLDLHQMGSTGPRQFVPPFAEPLAPNVNPLVWRMTSLIGTWMSLRLEQEGKAGVVSGWAFDGNWIGGTRNTGWWKNVFGLLTETAGAALATPIDIDENELRASGKGLQSYQPQINFPNPWRGGKWGLAEAVGYQSTLMSAFVEFAADHRAEALRGVAAMASQAVSQGKAGAPVAFVVKAGGDDPGRFRTMVNLLLEAGLEASVCGEGCTADETPVPPGSVVFWTAQPLRQFLLEVMGRQRYPEVSLGPDGDVVLPYDITAWTMPLYFGVEVARAERTLSGETTPLRAPLAPPGEAPGGEVVAIPAGQLAGYAVANAALAGGAAVSRLVAASRVGSRELAPGSFVIEARPGRRAVAAPVDADVVALDGVPAAAAALRRIRVGVYHPNLGLEDAGWCRWVLEQGGFAVSVVNNPGMRSGSFAADIDVLVVPPLSGKVIVEGPTQRVIEQPKEYQGGIGKSGADAVKKFVEAGGTAIGFAASAEWLAELVDAPVENALKGVERADLYAPGALLELEVENQLPLGWGTPSAIAALVDTNVAFVTRPVSRAGSRLVAARFPDEPLVISGWMRGEEKLRRRAAEVLVRQGKGRVVLFSFAPYFRGQTQATFPLLYNAVMLAMMEPGDRR